MVIMQVGFDIVMLDLSCLSESTAETFPVEARCAEPILILMLRAAASTNSSGCR
jgi:hypothetical protein